MFQYAKAQLTLSPERGALLWCIRIWGMAPRRPAGPAWHVPQIMAALDAPNAAPPFDAFMQCISRTATRPIAISCISANRISADEQALVDTLALAHHQRGFEALLLLREFTAPAGASEAYACALIFADAFKQAGNILDAPETCARQFAMTNAADTIRPTHPQLGIVP